MSMALPNPSECCSTCSPSECGTPINLTTTISQILSGIMGVVNVKDYGATGDGVTNDVVAIRAAIYAATGKPSRTGVYFPAGTYKCSGPLLISMLKITLFGQGAMLDFSSLASGTAIILIALGFGGSAVYYNNTVTPFSGLEIKGPGISSSVTAIGFDGVDSNSHIVFRDSAIHGFGTGINSSSAHVYLIQFDHCNLFECTTIFSHTGSPADSGERFSFTNCTLFNSFTAIDWQNYNGDLYLHNCSLDGIRRFIRNRAGFVYFSHCHFETSVIDAATGYHFECTPLAGIAAHINIRDSVMLWSGVNITANDAVFRCTAESPGGIFIDSTLFHGWIVSPGHRLVSGTGEVRFTNFRTYIVPVFDVLMDPSQNLLGDGFFELPSQYDPAGLQTVDIIDNITISGDTGGGITDRLTGANITLAKNVGNAHTGLNCLKATKIGGAATVAHFMILVPNQDIKDRYGFTFWYKSDGVLTPVYLYFIWAKIVGSRLTSGVPVMSQRSVQTTLTITPTVNYAQYYTQGTILPPPTWCTHFGLQFDFFDAPAGAFYLDDVEIYRF